MLPDDQLQRIRSRFPVFSKKIYLNSCSQGALSDAVEEGLRDYLASWHEHGSPWDLWIERYEAARTQFAQLIGAEADEVALVPSASAGINAVASALTFTERDRVVLGEFEFPTMGHIWLAQRKRGAGVVFVNAVGNRLPTENYQRAIDARTLIVPLTGICFMNGFRSKVAEIVRLAHAQGALVMLDDYQDCGTRPINVHDLDVDFYVAGTLKYLLGAPGLAYLYVKRKLIESLTPAVSGWFAQANPFAFEVKLFDPARSARRFEAGTPPVPNLYASMRGIALLEEIGLDRVAAQISGLTRAALERADRLGITSKTLPDSVGPLVVLECGNASAVVDKMAEAGIVCSCRHDGLRLSFHVYNTLEDIEAAFEVLKRQRHLVASSPAASGAR